MVIYFENNRFKAQRTIARIATQNAVRAKRIRPLIASGTPGFFADSDRVFTNINRAAAPQIPAHSQSGLQGIL
jgi:hypothetical protein